MSPEIFEESIECGLLVDGSDACEGGPALRELGGGYRAVDGLPGGYQRRRPEEYDRALGLIPQDALDFVYATQPKEWARLQHHHGAEVKERFLQRLAREIEQRGALDVLRNGIKDSGCTFRLAFFRPSSGLNEELKRYYEANLFAIVRQVRYSQKVEDSLDLVLFLNGVPSFTAEPKNPLTGQDAERAIKQYKFDRDPTCQRTRA